MGRRLSTSLRERIYSRNLSPADRAELERHLTQFAANGSVQDLLAAALADRTLPVNTRLTAASAMQGASLKTTPAVWVDVLVRCLAEAHFPVASAVAVLHRAARAQDSDGGGDRRAVAIGRQSADGRNGAA